jgi:hypothetical protein
VRDARRGPRARQRGGELSEQAAAVQIVYELNPKHKRTPSSPGRKGSLCPREADGPALLRSSDLIGKKRYATDGANAYCAQRHDPGNDPGRETWHGYLIGWEEVPPLLIAQWVAEDKVQRRIVRRAKRQREQ